MRKMPRPPRSIAGDDSSTKKELKKAYERISALEIRVHDLTLQVTSVRLLPQYICTLYIVCQITSSLDRRYHLKKTSLSSREIVSKQNS